MKITPEHNEVRTLQELDHYEAHPERTESPEFRKLKQEFHEAGAKCFIDNGYCDNGPIEIHHAVIEYSAGTEVDWEKVKADHNFDHVDAKVQMMPLCSRHHRGKYTGIHSVSYPIWLLQKYMTKEALADFEKAVKDALSR